MDGIVAGKAEEGKSQQQPCQGHGAGGGTVARVRRGKAEIAETAAVGLQHGGDAALALYVGSYGENSRTSWPVFVVGCHFN